MKGRKSAFVSISRNHLLESLQVKFVQQKLLNQSLFLSWHSFLTKRSVPEASVILLYQRVQVETVWIVALLIGDEVLAVLGHPEGNFKSPPLELRSVERQNGHGSLVPIGVCDVSRAGFGATSIAGRVLFVYNNFADRSILAEELAPFELGFVA
jgi:hypothetical protein